jgi:hypothetical protein
LTLQEKHLAQTKMKGIKERLKSDPDLHVREAATHIHAKWNSNPIGSDWLTHLGNAAADLDLYRYRLQQAQSRK